MQVVDAHQHFWQLERPDCSWPTADLAAIYRDFMPGDYPAADAIVATVLVQSQPNDSDTDFLLALAAASPLVKAVVGWVDLRSPQVEDRLECLRANPWFRGVRPMLQAIDDSDWILDVAAAPALGYLEREKLCFDALIQPRHLAAIDELAGRYPELRLVIDHGAKPDIARGQFSDWARAMERVARHGGVHCKLSGLLTEASASQWADASVFTPYIAHMLQVFGPERVMWGSDWPVVELAGTFDDWLTMARKQVGESVLESDFDLNMVFHGAATAFYRLDVS